MFNERFRNCIKQAKTYAEADMNSDHNPVVVKINMKLKRKNVTKGSEQLELNLLKEETYKNKYNVEVQNIYERLCIEETEQQPDNGSFNNQMKEEIEKALKSMKDGKATGPDELPAEALKALDQHNIEIITSLCNIIIIYGPSVKEQLMYKKMCIYALSITQKLSIESSILR